MFIRPYKLSDLPAIKELVIELQDFERALAPYLMPGHEIVDAYTRRLIGRCRRNRGRILVAIEDGRAVGFVSVWCVTNSDIESRIKSYAYVGDLCVKSACRRRGIGSALIAAAENFARESGQQFVFLNVIAANDAALKVYRQAGFREEILSLVKQLE